MSIIVSRINILGPKKDIEERDLWGFNTKN